MKKIIYYTAFLAGMMLLNTSCENYDEIKIPEKYHKVLILQTAGEQDLTLYRTGEDSEYRMSVIKAGSEDNMSATGKLEISEEWLAKYNEENARRLVMLPSNLYELADNQIQIGSDEKYKLVDMVLKTTLIDALIEANPEVQYALPIQLTSDDTTISQTNNYVIIRPRVVVPVVSFEKSGYQKTVLTSASANQITVEIPLTLPLTNNWTFDCGVGVNTALLDEYNQANKTFYQLLPQNSYTLDEKCSFAPGTSTSVIRLVIDRTKLAMGDYVLPVELQSCTQAGFEIGTENVYLAGISYVPPQIPLSLGMLSSNATHVGDGTGLAGLYDGLGSGKHYHSNWAGAVKDAVYGHYIDFRLGTAITSFMFDYHTRYENGNGAPLEINLYTSNNGTDWQMLATVSDANETLPRGGNMEYQSKIFTADASFTYLRFSVVRSAAGDVRNGSYFNLGEMSIFGE